MGTDPAAALGGLSAIPPAHPPGNRLNRTADHSVEGKKRLDKEEKAEEKNGNNRLISIEKTGFITYRLSVTPEWRKSFFIGYIPEAQSIQVSHAGIISTLF
jgi:hypothetical protein